MSHVISHIADKKKLQKYQIHPIGLNIGIIFANDKINDGG